MATDALGGGQSPASCKARGGTLKVGKDSAAALRLTGEFLRVSIRLHGVSHVTGRQQLRVDYAR